MDRRVWRGLLVIGICVRVAAGLAYAVDQPFSRAERFEAPLKTHIERENEFWRLEPIATPEGSTMEVTGMLPLPEKRLLVTTRRGELWFVDGAHDDTADPHYTLYASGLHEPLGISAAPGGGYYVVQRQELTHITDKDGDGRADGFKTIYRFPVSGNYHEFAFGPYPAPNGNLRVSLMLAYNAPAYSPVPWRGWILEISPEGRMTPIAAGIRAGFGITWTPEGVCLYTDNQGEWRGSNHVSVVESGDFMGHPGSLAWSKLPGSPVALQPGEIPDTGEPMHEVGRRVSGLRTPAVWIPYAVLGVSPTDIVQDRTEGSFGPFAGHFLVGDSGQSRILRMTLEQVEGEWQGACYPFRQGFQSGVTRLTFGEDGSLFVGETRRGWASVGGRSEAFERVRWTGRVPFAIKEVRAQPDGFLITFTKPVDRATAENPTSYGIAGFTYRYGSAYGSLPIHRVGCPIRRVVVAKNGLSARIGALCLREGYVHEVRAAGVRAAGDGATLLHDTAYYTLNRIPSGDRIIPPELNEAEWCAPPVSAVASAPGRKHPSIRPADWTNREGDRTILLGTLPGMKFDKEELHVIAGEAIQLVFRNRDEMLHNFVLCAPGHGQAVGTAALKLGIDGAAMNYVPDSDEVLYHTAIVQPGDTDRIYFTAPETPGDYDYICTFPGHALTMTGIMRVAPVAGL